MVKGVTWGSYRLLGRLAAGGMAEVFLAQRIDSPESFLAVKRMLPRLSDDPTFVSMFVDEAKIASGLSHPNICHIVDHGEQGHQLFIAMEFIHGKDLRVLARRVRKRGETIPVRLVMYVMAEIADALDYAHHKVNDAGVPENIVHRDISPQNILVSYDGVAKLIDFGVAKAKDRVAQTQVGVVKGKFAYMAPEQASGNHVDARTDIFALGVVLYELCTGVLPFKGESDLSTLKRIARGEYVPPQHFNPEVSGQLTAMIARALQHNPNDRYTRAAELATDLRCLLTDDSREVNDAVVSSYMRRLFREDYIGEMGRLKTYASREPQFEHPSDILRRPEESGSRILAAGYDPTSGSGPVFTSSGDSGASAAVDSVVDDRPDFAGPTLEVPVTDGSQSNPDPNFFEPTVRLSMEPTPVAEMSAVQLSMEPTPVVDLPMGSTPAATVILDAADARDFEIEDAGGLQESPLGDLDDSLGEFPTTDLDGEINEIIDSADVNALMLPEPAEPSTTIPTQISRSSSPAQHPRRLFTSAEIAVLVFTAALGFALVAGIYIFF